MKKFLQILCCALLLSTALAGSAAARGNIWMDRTASPLPTAYERIVVFPIVTSPDAPERPDLAGSPDVQEELYKTLVERAQSRLSGKTVLRFAMVSDAGKDDARIISRLSPAYGALLQPFATEEARAAAVRAATHADGYLVPCVVRMAHRTDTAPETEATAQLESYYDIENGPHGDEYHHHWHTWSETFRIGGTSLDLLMGDVVFVLFDARTGRPAMTLVDHYRRYSTDEGHAFDQITKNFTGDWQRLKDDRDTRARADAPTLGFAALGLPETSHGDRYEQGAITYALEAAAGNTLKKLRPAYAAKAEDCRYYVTGRVTHCALQEHWQPPSLSTEEKREWSDTFYWRDKDGKEHTGTRVYYRTSVSENPGHYNFDYAVRGTLSLVDARTGRTLLTREFDETDSERYANALYKAFTAFFKDADKIVGQTG